MAAQPIHTKILNAAAREVLRPLGVRQEGRSRNWYDDARWYVTNIEFQPSGFLDRGAYLNVGIQWLWYPRSYRCMDLGDRENGFVSFENEDQFRAEALELVQLAAARVVEYRSNAATLADAYDSYAARFAALQPVRPGNWYHFHMGVLAALTGRVAEARRHLTDALLPDSDIDWEQERNGHVEAILEVIDDPAVLCTWVEERIAECRSLLKLDACDPPVLPAS